MISTKSTLMMLGSIALISACQTYDPYTGESKVSKATTFGGLGAVLCGIIGAGEGGKEARNAALACGIAGAGIGAYMDAQEKTLREELVGSGVQVVRDGDDIRLVMPNSITFEFGQSSLNPAVQPTLNSVVTVLNKYTETNLQVAGHTDSIGSEQANQTLSLDRANSVASYLTSQQLPPARLNRVGFGETRPIADNGTDEGRAQNRRVELIIEPRPVS